MVARDWTTNGFSWKQVWLFCTLLHDMNTHRSAEKWKTMVSFWMKYCVQSIISKNRKKKNWQLLHRFESSSTMCIKWFSLHFWPSLSQGSLVIRSMVGTYFSHGFGLYSCLFGVYPRMQWFPKLYTYVAILWNIDTAWKCYGNQCSNPSNSSTLHDCAMEPMFWS